MAPQITVVSIVYWTLCSGEDQSSASLAFVRGIYRGPMNSPHLGPVTQNMFLFDDVIMDMIICKMAAILFRPPCFQLSTAGSNSSHAARGHVECRVEFYPALLYEWFHWHCHQTETWWRHEICSITAAVISRVFLAKMVKNIWHHIVSPRKQKRNDTCWYFSVACNQIKSIISILLTDDPIHVLRNISMFRSHVNNTILGKHCHIGPRAITGSYLRSFYMGSLWYTILHRNSSETHITQKRHRP